MDLLLQDLRYGFRAMRLNIGFTAVAVITLALGIGANTAIFSVVNAVLLRPLPFPKSEQLMILTESNPQLGAPEASVAVPTYQDWKAQSRSFADMGAYVPAILSYAANDGAVRLNAAKFTPSLFSTLAVNPILGRTFTEEEGQPGHSVVILSETVWERSFGRDRSVVGKVIQLNAHPYTIVGVMPKSFAFPENSCDVWTALSLEDFPWQIRTARQLNVVGRLKDSASILTANAEMKTIASQIEKAYPDTNKNWTAGVTSLHEDLVGNVRPALLILLGAVTFLLLISCVNVASLLSARMTSRQKEIGLRTALGATRPRIVRQLLTESMLLGFIGGVGGILLAALGLNLFVNYLPAGTLPRVEEIGLDANVLWFTFLVSIAMGSVFGLAPALQTSKTDLNTILKAGGAGLTAERGQNVLRNTLVVSEIVLSLVLLAGSGLLIRTFIRLRNIDPGFKSEGVLVNTQLLLPTAKYGTEFKGTRFFKDLIERVQRIPGVQSVGGITGLPLQSNSEFTSFAVAGRPLETQRIRGAVLDIVTPDYFRTMTIPLKQGRFFTDRDDQSAQKTALINETMVHMVFDDQNPIGQRLLVGTKDPAEYEIVGIVGDVRQFGLRDRVGPEIFTHYLQNQTTYMYVLVKGSGDPTRFFPAVRHEVIALDPNQPVGYRTLSQQYENSVASPKFYTVLLGVFATTSLILAAVGIYGVMSYSVTQRTREVGIRMALGASSGDVLRLIVTQGLKLAAAGVVLGLLASYWLTRYMKSMLFSVEPNDLITFAAVTVILTSVALISCYIPARRATCADPMQALRTE